LANQQRGLSLNLNFLKGITNQLKLIGRLMVDSRVPPLLKLLPVGAIIYLIVPTDLMPLLPFDDAAVLWLGGNLIIEMCPRAEVQEHLRAIEGEASVPFGGETASAPPPDPAADVIDAEFHDASGPKQP